MNTQEIINKFVAIAQKQGYSKNCIDTAISNAQKSGQVTPRALVNYLSDAVGKGCVGTVGHDAEFGRKGTLGR